MPIRLETPKPSHEKEYNKMIKEFIDKNERIIPKQMKKEGEEKFDGFLTRIKGYKEQKKIPVSIYFILDTTKKIVGGISIRNYLNDELKTNAGNIGYSIKPSERKKGYASEALHLACEKCKKMGMKEVLVICKKENIGSAKVIQKNGGKRNSDFLHICATFPEGVRKERYIISL